MIWPDDLYMHILSILIILYCYTRIYVFAISIYLICKRGCVGAHVFINLCLNMLIHSIVGPRFLEPMLFFVLVPELILILSL